MNWQSCTSSSLAHLRQAVFYPPTGTGRDSYIMINNGGTSLSQKPQGVPTHGNFMKFGRVYSQTKPVSMDRHRRYMADGTGRDNYITSKWNPEGTVSEKMRMFRSTFRDGETERNWSSWKSTKEMNPEGQAMVTRRLSVPKQSEKKYVVKLQEIKLRNLRKEERKGGS